MLNISPYPDYLVEQGIAMEKKEARAEKDEAEKYQKLQDDHVS